MSEQKGKSIFKKWWFWAIVIVVIGIIGAASNKGKTNDVNGNVASTTSSISTTTPLKTTQSATAPAFDWATAELNEENIKLAIKDIPVTGFMYEDSSIVQVDVTAGSTDASKKVTIIIDPGTPLNEDGFARVLMQMTVKYSEVLFTNPAVGSVAVHNIIHLKDSYGKSSSDDTSFVMFSRETAEKLDYEGFIDNVWGDYSRCYRVADSYFIYQGVYNKLSEANGMTQSK